MAENSFLNEAKNDNLGSLHTSTERNFITDVAKSYAEQRKEKAIKQSEDEKNGISKVKLSERTWDEMKSYRYAIL